MRRKIEQAERFLKLTNDLCEIKKKKEGIDPRMLETLQCVQERLAELVEEEHPAPKRRRRNPSKPNRITLNIGGMMFETEQKTLLAESNSLFSIYLSGRFDVERDEDGSIFIDRDPTHFSIILEHLRDLRAGVDPSKEYSRFRGMTDRERLAAKREAGFYCLDRLERILSQPTFWVSKEPQGNCFSSLKDAVLAVPAGSRIIILPGVYTESINLDKSVDIIGDGPREQIRLHSGQNIILSTAPLASLRNVTVRQTGGKFNGLLVCGGHMTIEDCDISSEGLGCVAVRRASATVRGNVIHNCKAGGLVFTDGAEGRIEGNDVVDNGLQGVEIRDGARPTVVGNRISKCTQNGILIHSEGSGVVENNIIVNNGVDGIMVIRNGKPTIIRNNVIHNNKNRGIFVSYTANPCGYEHDNLVYANTDDVVIDTNPNGVVVNVV